MRVSRFPSNPLIHKDLAGLPPQSPISINGASVIRAPLWLPGRPAEYLMYFAHHNGTEIRLACSDDLQGPWKVMKGGSLQLADTACIHHIASPDVHIDDERNEILMYFHGPRPDSQEARSLSAESQVTMLATSRNGINFNAESNVLGHFYFRFFRHAGVCYAIAKNENKGGLVYRSATGRSDFVPGPEIIPRMRHCAVLVRETTLYIFFSRLFDAPESIYMTTIDLEQDWREWNPKSAVLALKPELAYEGAMLPVNRSLPGMPAGPVNELRDPFIFSDSGKLYLFYSAAGEQAIAGAEIEL